MMPKPARKIFNSASVPPAKCVFCRIVKKELPSHILYEDQKYIAFLDIAPFSRGHTLVCPKKHGETMWDMDESEIGGLFTIASKISRALMAAVDADGFRFVQNNGEAANQVVAHVHVHVIPVRLEDKGRYGGRKDIPEEEMGAIARNAVSEINKMGPLGDP
ncbi:MAG: HIT domain-containing protein [Nitrososphaerota archaeon]|nr:HIT domain-containing protein [Nitrososphaerota archaeon]